MFPERTSSPGDPRQPSLEPPSWLRHVAGPLFLQLGFWLILNQLCRLLFYIYQSKIYEPFSVKTLLIRGFLAGMRFDFASVCALSLPGIFVTLLYFLGLRRVRWACGVMAAAFVIPQASGLAVNLLDAGYFGFTDRRSTLSFFKISADIQNQFTQIFKHYWPLFIIGFLFLYLLFKFISLFPAKKFMIFLEQGKKYQLGVICLVSVTLILGIRGGLQRKPLHPAHAFAGTLPALGHLALNTTLSMIHSDSQNEVQRLNIFADSRRALNQFNPRRSLPAVPFERAYSLAASPPLPPQNVVVIVMESFGREYMGFPNGATPFTPFLDSLAHKGLFFNRTFANGRRSIEALPSIFGSAPSLMNESFVLSPYQGNSFVGLPQILSQLGYKTAFFHGGKNGTFFFDLFAQRAGFASYIGMNEYPHKTKDFDGSWGIFDEPFFRFFSSSLDGFKEPFFAGFFSLSSHNPYTLPKPLEHTFPKGDIPIHKTIAYADWALKQFFEEAAKRPWFSRTLFVITADHTSESSRKVFQESQLGAYWIPLLFYHPQGLLPLQQNLTQRIVQQADIAPSILHFLGLEEHIPRLAPFGISVFDTHKSGRAIHKSGSIYTFISNDLVLTWNFPHTDADSRKVYRFLDKNPLNLVPEMDQGGVLTDEIEDLFKDMQAYIQFYNNGLLENSWYDLPIQ